MIEGKVSSPLPSTSGGPLLFVLYINVICDVCTSFMQLYADDAKTFRKIKSRQDVLSLQNDLNAMFLWSKIWRMNFNISKGKFMSICRKVKIDFAYSIDNNILSRVTEFNDLGITITTKLSWCENVKTFIKIPFYDRNDKTFCFSLTASLMLSANYIWLIWLWKYSWVCGVPLMLNT